MAKGHRAGAVPRLGGEDARISEEKQSEADRPRDTCVRFRTRAHVRTQGKRNKAKGKRQKEKGSSYLSR
jgi:hypothetical protein